MSLPPELNFLQEYVSEYTSYKDTSFKYTLKVAKNEKEVDYYTEYMKFIADRDSKLNPAAQSTTTGTTGATGGWPTGGLTTGTGTTGWPTGGLTTGTGTTGWPTGGSTTGTTGATNTWGQPTGQQQQQQIQTTGLREDMTSKGKLYDMDIHFFEGLKHRLDHQQQRQKKMKEAFEEMEKQIEEIRTEIEETITTGLKEIEKKSFEIDRRIVELLSEHGNIEPVVIAKFKDLQIKMESTDIVNRTRQLMNMVENREKEISSLGEQLSKETIDQLTETLSLQQDIIMEFVDEINDMMGKYYQMKASLSSIFQ